MAVGLAGVHDVRAADLKPGDLPGLTAPSLFGGGCLVIVRSVQDADQGRRGGAGPRGGRPGARA